MQMRGTFLSICVLLGYCAPSCQEQTFVAEFKGYKNAWVVKVDDNSNEQDYTEIVHVCKRDCLSVSASDTQIVDCVQLKQLVNTSQWFHHQMSAWSQSDWVVFCDAISGHEDVSWKQRVDVAVESGMHILQPFSVEIKNNPSALAPFAGGPQWLQEWTDNDIASMRLTLRITHIFPHDTRFAVFFSMLVVEVPKPRQQLITTGVRSQCRQLGYVAPQYSHLFLRYLHGQTQCVWECLVDTLRQPFNAPPPAEGETSNKTCARLPAEFMAVVFGFTLETEVHVMSALDLSEEFFTALDDMAKAVSSEVAARTEGTVLTALQIPGSMQSVGSFQDRLENMQAYRGVLYTWGYSANHNFAHAAPMQRRLLGSHVSDLRVEGFLVTALNASLHDVWLGIQKTVVAKTETLSESLKVIGVLDVDLGLAVTVQKTQTTERDVDGNVVERDAVEPTVDNRTELWQNLLPLIVAASVCVSIVLVFICQHHLNRRPVNASLHESMLTEVRNVE